MPFEPHDNNIKIRIAGASVAMGVYPSGKEAVIRISVEVAQKLNWSEQDRVIFSEGYGTDIQHAQITKAANGIKLNAFSKKGDLAFKFPVSRFKHHKLPDTHVVVPVEFQAFGGSLLIILPDFCEPITEEPEA